MEIINLVNRIRSVSNIELDSINLSYIDEFTPVIGVDGHREENFYFYQNSGREHYRILTYISSILEDQIIFDIGTNYCLSALSLSSNKKNSIISYDIIDKIDLKFKKEKLSNINIEFLIGDCREDSRLKDSNFIFFDAEHDGIFENLFYDYLKSIDWKGILLLDDIHLNEHMVMFWNRIKEEKYDITSIGHWSGTGMVIFN